MGFVRAFSVKPKPEASHSVRLSSAPASQCALSPEEGVTLISTTPWGVRVSL